jgi:hypothetical protein
LAGKKFKRGKAKMSEVTLTLTDLLAMGIDIYEHGDHFRMEYQGETRVLPFSDILNTVRMVRMGKGLHEAANKAGDMRLMGLHRAPTLNLKLNA